MILMRTPRARGTRTDVPSGDRASASPERVALSQEPAPHIGVPCCEPDAYTGGNGDHAWSSSAAAMRPFTSTTSIMPFALERSAEGSAPGAEAVVTAGDARSNGHKDRLLHGLVSLEILYLIQR